MEIATLLRLEFGAVAQALCSRTGKGGLILHKAFVSRGQARPDRTELVVGLLVGARISI